MRTLLRWVAITLLCISAHATEAPEAIYDADPEHLWNRLYRAFAIRTENGTRYGIDNALPFDDEFDDPEHLAAVLDEFVEGDGEKQASGELGRALFQHDVWAAFDLAARGERNDLARKLASVVGRLRMQDRSIAALPDNYAEAVRSGGFADDFDPTQPEVAFLPPDLFEPDGPWIEVGEGGQGLVAPVHVQSLSGRSAFRVFIRTPGGRSATLAYLQRLNLHRTPWALKPVEIGITDPDERQVRGEPALDPATPQFPAGTIVALVRQMAVVNEYLEPVMTTITQSVQFRVFRKVSADAYRDWRANFGETQSVFEFDMRRRDILSSKAGGLHRVGPEEAAYQLIGGLHGPRSARLRGSVVLSTCVRCHSGNGIFSVNSYTRHIGPRAINPQLLPADSVDYQGRTALEWKKQRFDWGLLRGLLERGR